MGLLREGQFPTMAMGKESAACVEKIFALSAGELSIWQQLREMQTPSGELQGSSSPLKLMLSFGCPSFLGKKARIAVHLGEAKSINNRNEQLDAVRKFCY